MSRTVSFVWVLVAYAVAIAVAWGTEVAMGAYSDDVLVRAGVADVAATFVIFGFSLVFWNSSMYDAYWSVAPVPIYALFLAQPEAAAGDPVRQALVGIVVLYWAIRLTLNWATGWPGMGHEDWRYVRLAKQTGRLWPLVSLTGVHLFPTVLVFGGCLAMWPAVTSSEPLGILDAVAFVVGMLAVTIEAVSDIQLRRFARNRRDPQEVMRTGLWAWSRHPNYLGEIGFWFGLYLFALATGPQAAWTGVGVLAMLLLFVGISIPMMERRMVAKRPGYQDVQRQIPMLFPWPFRRGADSGAERA
ncbi:MAG: DUF1295 domain-containing protein [Myxococcota bacterium]